MEDLDDTDHKAKVDGYVKEAKAAGAEVRLGGDDLSVEGLTEKFYQPTVVADVTANMAIPMRRFSDRCWQC